MIPCETCISFAICIHKNVISNNFESFLRIGYMTGHCQIFKKWWYTNYSTLQVTDICKLYKAKSAVG